MKAVLLTPPRKFGLIGMWYGPGKNPSHFGADPVEGMDPGIKKKNIYIYSPNIFLHFHQFLSKLGMHQQQKINKHLGLLGLIAGLRLDCFSSNFKDFLQSIYCMHNSKEDSLIMHWCYSITLILCSWCISTAEHVAKVISWLESAHHLYVLYLYTEYVRSVCEVQVLH